MTGRIGRKDFRLNNPAGHQRGFGGISGNRLYVALGASKVGRRLKGHGFGVRKVKTAGRNRAVIIHTATGERLRQQESLFEDVIEANSPEVQQ